MEVWIFVATGILAFVYLLAKLVARLKSIHIEFEEIEKGDDFEIQFPKEIKPTQPKRRQLKK